MKQVANDKLYNLEHLEKAKDADVSLLQTP